MADYVIMSDSERGYWSNSIGWVSDTDQATRFPQILIESLNLPMSAGSDARWTDASFVSSFLPVQIKSGDIVYWKDPDHGISSGHYSVAYVNAEEGTAIFAEDILFITNGSGSEAEVLACEVEVVVISGYSNG